MWTTVVILVTMGTAGQIGTPVMGASKTNVQVSGAGASFPESVYREWMSSFKNYRASHVDVHMTYEAVGSGSGRKRMIEKDSSIIYGASDSLMSLAEKQTAPDIELFPSMAGAVVIGYNIPDLIDPELNLVLSLDTLTGIYNGTILFWNHSSIQNLNPDIDLPNKTIIVLARADSSGTTDIFTRYLSKSAAWKDQYGPFKKKTGWPSDTITFFAYQSRGMTGLMLSFEYSIGYVSIGEAIWAGVLYADLLNDHGKQVAPLVESVQSTMDDAVSGNSPQLDAILTDIDSPEGYPIAGFTFIIIYMTEMADCNKAKELVRYIDWILSSETADKDCIRKQMTPLSAKLKGAIRSAVLNKIQCDGLNMWKEASKDIAEETKESNLMAIYAGVTSAILGSIVLAIAVRFALKYYLYNKMLNKDEWEILIEDIVFFHTSRSQSSGQCRFTLWPSITSLTEIDDVDEGYMMLNHILQWPGKFNGNTVGLRLLEIKGLKHIGRREKMLLLSFKDTISHLNILKFYGLTKIETEWYTVSEYCAKGCLTDVLRDKKLSLNKDFKFSLSFDIASGLSYLHSEGIVHGFLSSSTCLIDFRWTVKISDWEILRTISSTQKTKNPMLLMRKNPDDIGVNEASFHSFWAAPEILQSDYTCDPATTMDIYSYSIILQEIFTRDDPYVEHADTVSPQELVKAIINNKLRPSHQQDVPGTIRHIQECAWSEDPSKRPSAEQLIKMIRAIHSFKRSVIDAMMESAEEYTLSLEEQLTNIRTDLSKANEKLNLYTNRMLFPVFNNQTNFDDSKCSIPSKSPVQRVNACIVCIKCKQNIAQNNLWPALNNLDMMLDHFADMYSAHRLDIGTGVFLLILSSTSKSTLHVVNAAKLCLQLVQYTKELLNGIADSEKIFGFQVAIHKGPVFACFMNNYLPRSYIIGENVEFSYTLVEKSKLNCILISKTFHDALDTLAKGIFKLEKAIACTNGSVERSMTYWLKGEATEKREEVPSEVNLPVMV